MHKRIYLSSPTMHGLEMKYIQEAFDSNWVAPLGKNVVAPLFIGANTSDYLITVL